MYVIKRDGRQEPVHFDKLTSTLKKLSYGLSKDHCDPALVAQKVYSGVYEGVTTTQLAELASETAAALTANHPDYALVSFFFQKKFWHLGLYGLDGLHFLSLLVSFAD